MTTIFCFSPSSSESLFPTPSLAFSFTPPSPAAKFSGAFLVRRRTACLGMQTHPFSAGRKEILDGMLGANLVCFQTYSYSRHFISTCIRVCGYETTSRGIDVEGHGISVMHCPVGIDAERVARDMCVIYGLDYPRLVLMHFSVHVQEFSPRSAHSTRAS